MGSVVLQVMAHHSGGNIRTPIIHYKLLSDSFSLPFYLNETTGDIIVYKFLDYESTKLYSFFVQAIDLSQLPIGSNTVRCDIAILDINDNMPVFSPQYYDVTVPESIPSGLKIVQVFASDLDSGDCGSVTFVIKSGNDQNFFSIDSNGNILISKPLDYETTKLYILNISAVDSAGLTSVNQAMIYITITDVNDFYPVFLLSKYYFSISENQSIPYEVGNITAIDGDGSNNNVSYSIADNNLFSIDANGILRLIATLDYELQTSLTFFVFAVDGNLSKSQTQVIVTILTCG